MLKEAQYLTTNVLMSTSKPSPPIQELPKRDADARVAINTNDRLDYNAEYSVGVPYHSLHKISFSN